MKQQFGSVIQFLERSHGLLDFGPFCVALLAVLSLLVLAQLLSSRGQFSDGTTADVEILDASAHAAGEEKVPVAITDMPAQGDPFVTFPLAPDGARVTGHGLCRKWAGASRGTCVENSCPKVQNVERNSWAFVIRSA